MKNTITLLLCCLLITNIFAQTDKKGKLYDKTYYKDATIELGEVTLFITDFVATDAYMKFKIKVKNNTSDFILFDPNIMTITTEGNDYKSSERKLFVGPNDMESRVVDIKGPAFRTAGYTIKIDGLSKVPATGKFTEAPNFALPVSNNEITVSNYRIVHKFNDKKTDKTAVKFEITYTGTKVGIVDPAKIVLKMSKGNQYANMNPNRKPHILMPNESDIISVMWTNIGTANGDMQFDNMEILWKDALMEAPASKLAGKTITIEYDPGLTVGKN